jgi:hypothetical protein
MKEVLGKPADVAVWKKASSFAATGSRSQHPAFEINLHTMELNAKQKIEFPKLHRHIAELKRIP